jgi:hypothetical protein
MTDKRTGKKAKRPPPPKAAAGADATADRVIAGTAGRPKAKPGK